jgi:pimeloyl-ACP methyl ester carboxylesterase
MPTLELDDVSIAYERAGSGPALVLLHGGLSDHREWRRQVDGLADAFTVVAWDAPGCGGSTDPPASFRMPDYADRLAAFIDTLGLEAPAVLGLSWGSTLALELYRRRPDIPARLILTAAYAGWAGSLPPEEVERRLRTSLRDLGSLHPEAFVRTWLPTLFTDRAAPETIEGYVAVMADFHPAGVEPMIRALAEADLRDVLPTIAVPTLLLFGGEDRRASLDVARGMRDAIPGSTLEVLAGVGHMSNLETPDRFNEAVRRFLSAR